MSKYYIVMTHVHYMVQKFETFEVICDCGKPFGSGWALKPNDKLAIDMFEIQAWCKRILMYPSRRNICKLKSRVFRVREQRVVIASDGPSCGIRTTKGRPIHALQHIHTQVYEFIVP